MEDTLLLIASSISLCCVLHTSSTESAGCTNTSYNYQLFSTRTAYATVKGQELKPNRHKEWQLEQIYMVLRHGTRHPGRNEVEAMRDTLPKLRAAILKSAKTGRLCNSVLKQIYRWRLRLEAERDLGIADGGQIEMYELGKMVRRLDTELFNLTSQANLQHLEVQHTGMDRTRLSAESFVRGLFELEIYGPLPEALENRLYSMPKHQDKLLLYIDNCKKHIKGWISSNNTEKIETFILDNSATLSQMASDLTSRLGLLQNPIDLETIWVIYEACRYESVLLGESPWCNIFTVRELQLAEYRFDMKYYWRYGYGSMVNYQSSCILASDIIKSFSDILKRKRPRRSVFRFGHSRSILPLLTRLGLFQTVFPLTGNNIPLHVDRKWKLSQVNPFSSNVAFLLYLTNNVDYVLKIYVNEREVKLPGCRSTVCPLRRVLSLWKHIEEDCDYDSVCHDDLDLSAVDDVMF